MILLRLTWFMYFEQEIHSLKTQLEAAKFDVIKYCIGIAFFIYLYFMRTSWGKLLLFGLLESVSKLESLRSRSLMYLVLYVVTALGPILCWQPDLLLIYFVVCWTSGTIVSLTAVGLGMLRLIMWKLHYLSSPFCTCFYAAPNVAQ